MENRIGYVDISLGLIEATPEFFVKGLADCEVLSAEDHHEVYGRRRFKLRCAEFDEIKPGDYIPQYIFYWEYDDKGNIVRLPVEKL